MLIILNWDYLKKPLSTLLLCILLKYLLIPYIQYSLTQIYVSFYFIIFLNVFPSLFRIICEIAPQFFFFPLYKMDKYFLTFINLNRNATKTNLYEFWFKLQQILNITVVSSVLLTKIKRFIKSLLFIYLLPLSEAVVLVNFIPFSSSSSLNFNY